MNNKHNLKAIFKMISSFFSNLNYQNHFLNVSDVFILLNCSIVSYMLKKIRTIKNNIFELFQGLSLL